MTRWHWLLLASFVLVFAWCVVGVLTAEPVQ